MNINIKIIFKIIFVLILFVIWVGEINPFLFNAESTILYYLAIGGNILFYYIEYLLIKKILKEMKNVEKK